MNPERRARRSYEESCRLLRRLGYLGVGNSGEIPPLPGRRPRCDDDEPLGVSFFRTFVGDNALEDLTLPRTFFGRSEVGPVSFRNTDLSESTLCWNDFNGVDFTAADLSGGDLRASVFTDTVFLRANLRDADLRRSTFDGCDFTDADLHGAKLTHAQGHDLVLSAEQRRVIDWQDGEGEEPPGG
ncbi:MAG: pentapeptide repeat-containing protein [Gemmataceae bacterium]|nr:pentapeptide repeat-containing protein [Gemmataceae bacterium]